MTLFTRSAIVHGSHLLPVPWVPHCTRYLPTGAPAACRLLWSRPVEWGGSDDARQGGQLAYLTLSVTQYVIAQAAGKHTSARTTSPAAPGLTDREQEILQLVAEELTNKQIAQRLVISPATAKTHLARIMQKLGVSTQTQAAMFSRSSDHQ